MTYQVFRCIFTSPSSAYREEEQGATQRPVKAARGNPRPRNNVAELLRMRAVQPRAIAYIAAQVR